MAIQQNYKLKKWGQLTSFQKDLIDEVHKFILEHHSKTLNNIHSGSIIRSTIFIFRELFGEYIPGFIEKHFNQKVHICLFKIKIGETLNQDEIILEKDIVKQENTRDFSFTESENSFLTPTAIYEFDNTPMDETVWEDVKTILSNVVRIINKECVEIGTNNQIARDHFLKSVHEVFETDDLGTEFFHDLLETAKEKFGQAERLCDFDSAEEFDKNISFQIMLFLPQSPGNPDRDEGCFVYPHFFIDENLPIIFDEDKYYFDKIIVGILGKKPDSIETIDEQFYHDLFLEPLVTRMKNDEKFSRNVTDSWDSTSLEEAIKKLFTLYSSWDKESGERFVCEMVVGPEKIKSIFDSIIESPKNELFKGNEVLLWKNAFDDIELLAYQTFGEGVVGKFAPGFLPIRVDDQQLPSLKLNKRTQPYAIMGLLEGGYNIGGGSNPATVFPLTAKGQLLGALVVTKDKELEKFSTSELVTLEFISNWIADNVQEAKDTFVYRHLEQVVDLQNMKNCRKLISNFLSAIAIVTNVIKVKMIETGHRTQNTPILENEKDKWCFHIPNSSWSGKAEFNDIKFELTFAEPDDIIENYKTDITRLYRTILHMLGLRASGIAIDNNDSIYKKIGKFALHLSSQTEFLKGEFGDIDVSPLSGDITSDLKSFRLEQISAGRKCDQCHKDFSNYNLFEDSEKARKVKDCMCCWWTKAEEVEADGKMRAQVRSLVYKLGKAYQNGTVIHGENVKRYADGIFF